MYGILVLFNRLIILFSLVLNLTVYLRRGDLPQGFHFLISVYTGIYLWYLWWFWSRAYLYFFQNAPSLFFKAFVLGADSMCSGRSFPLLTIPCVNEWAIIVISTFSVGILRLWVVLPFIGMTRASSELPYMTLINLYVSIKSPLSLLKHRVGSESFRRRSGELMFLSAGTCLMHLLQFSYISL